MLVLAECSSGLSSRRGGWPCCGWGARRRWAAARMCCQRQWCACSVRAACLPSSLRSPPLDCSCVIMAVGEHVWAQARHSKIADRAAVPDGVAVRAHHFHVVVSCRAGCCPQRRRGRRVPAACCHTPPAVSRAGLTPRRISMRVHLARDRRRVDVGLPCGLRARADHRRLGLAGRMTISGPSAKIWMGFLWRRTATAPRAGSIPARSTNPVTCSNAQAMLQYENREARRSCRGRAEACRSRLSLPSAGQVGG
jgi:hypothetical protein